MIDPKIKEAWLAHYPLISGNECLGCVVLNAYLDAEAGRRMAEFWRYHDEHDPESCMECDSVKTVDEIDLSERHTWDLAKWRDELEKELNGN